MNKQDNGIIMKIGNKTVEDVDFEEIPFGDVSTSKKEPIKGTEKDIPKDKKVVKNKESKSKPKKAEPRIQQTVNIEDLKEEEKTTATIDFGGGSYADKLLSKETQKSDLKVDVEKENIENLSAEEIREKIKQEESDVSEQWSLRDFEDIAEMVIQVLDTAISTGLRVYSGDTSTSAYSISKGQVDRLKKSLAMILVKYQAKWSIEFLFILSLIAVYSTPVIKAREFKKNGKPRKKGRA
jgi:hypothetical protein